MSGKISVINFGDVPQPYIDHIVSTLPARFDRQVVSGAPSDVPKTGFDSSRNQYLAGAFLKELRPGSEAIDSKYLGVTTVDIYSRGLSFVFGQADVGGPAAVISLARLHPEGLDGGGALELLRSRLVKEAIHELGHTFGLAHCREKSCVMRFSSCLPDTDFKNADFCLRHEADLCRSLSGRHAAAG